MYKDIFLRKLQHFIIYEQTVGQCHCESITREDFKLKFETQSTASR